MLTEDAVIAENMHNVIRKSVFGGTTCREGELEYEMNE